MLKGKSAVVTGSTVALGATTGSKNTAHAESFVLALFGSSSASPQVNMTSNDTAILDGDSGSTGVVTGVNGVDVRALEGAGAAGGLAGVKKAVDIFVNEIDLVMGQIGCPSLSDLGPDFLWTDDWPRNR